LAGNKTAKASVMSDATTDNDQEGDVETALLDAELFIKYHAPERAIKRLRTALERSPRSLQLRERLREIAQAKHPEEAARQCLALASLYIEREELQTAHDRLLEAKNLDPRISIAPGLDAIRRARRPNLQQGERPANVRVLEKPKSTFAGDLAVISIFDAIQVIENSRLTGALSIVSDARLGRVHFNEGRIVGAETGETTGEDAFRKVVEATSGSFDFEKSIKEFPVTINAISNTNLILDSLRQLDEEKM
jgi:tetratricopeptide (TPR) repeat protein